MGAREQRKDHDYQEGEQKPRQAASDKPLCGLASPRGWQEATQVVVGLREEG